MVAKKVNLLYLFCVILMLYSCNKTNKSALTQGYHDLTAHYNSNWNANDKYKTVIKNIDHTPGDDFDSLINLYSYENKATAAAFTADYDAIIKKATMSIQQHEVSKWSDNNFLLMGMAHFLKGDYLKSADHFQYITSEYKTGYKNEYVNKKTLKKKIKKEKEKKNKLKAKIKKEKNSKDKAALKDELNARPHEKTLGSHPSRSAAVIMLARSYIKSQEFDKASSVLTFIEADKTIPDNYMPDFLLAQAEYYVAMHNEEKAIAPLKKAIAGIKKKKSKARPTFVLAQLYERIGGKDSAAMAYKAVLKSNPDYNMEFTAKLKIAELAASGTDAPEAKTILVKMARDGKNADMLDQIYYQLGKIYQKENNTPEAIVNFKKSLAKNKSNTRQKGLSLLALADIYYDDENYRDARNYYDSTLAVINNKATNYSTIKERSAKLDNLITQIDIIETQDSLTEIAQLSDADRKKRVQDIVFNELKAKEKEADDKQKLESASLTSKTDIGDPNSSFYFYNSSSRSKGYTTFKRLWGDRKLEDNWRRGEKSFDGSTTASSGGAGDSAADGGAINFEQKKEIDRINQLIPISEEQIKASDDKVIDAYFLLANGYKDDFNNWPKSIETFEKLLSKYPNNKYQVESYYNLYLLYAKVNNSAKSLAYKDKILKEYASSKFAQAITDPKSIIKVKSREEEATAYYNATYELFNQKKYDLVTSRSNEALTTFKGTKLEPQFAFLNAISLGYNKKYEEYKMALDHFISTYPTHPLKDKASELMLYLSDIDKYKREDSLANMSRKIPDAVKVIPKDSAVVVKKDEAKKPDESKSVVKEESKKDKKEKEKEKKAQKLKEHIEDSIAAYTDSIQAIARIDSLVRIGELMPPGMDLSMFAKDEKAVHRLIIKPIKAALVNTDLLNRIQDFETKTPAFKKLLVTSLLLNADNKLVLVKEFLDEATALTYYDAFMKSEEVFKGLNKKDFKIFIVTAKNQGIAVGANSIDAAFWFFKKNYLK